MSNLEELPIFIGCSYCSSLGSMRQCEKKKLKSENEGNERTAKNVHGKNDTFTLNLLANKEK